MARSIAPCLVALAAACGVAPARVADDAPAPPVRARALAAGQHASCAIRDGAVVCWGTFFGAAPLAPSRVAGVERAVAVAIGGDRACALTASGAAWCWDGGRASQVAGLPPAVALDAGSSHACVVTRARSVRCWGSMGQPLVTVHAGEDVSGLPPASSVACGHRFSCALAYDGRVWCWGNGYDGTHGDGARADRMEPRPVPGLDEVVEIVTAWHAACALRRDGTVACWGNFRGRTDASPVVIEGLPGPAVALYRDGHRVAIRLEDGRVARLHAGAAAIEERLAGAREIAGGLDHVCADGADGAIRCFGDHRRGQLGISSRGGRRSLDALLVADLTDARELSLGDRQSCALRAGGDVVCWGQPDPRRFREPIDRPRAVTGLADATALTRGWPCARRAGTAWACWGPGPDEASGGGGPPGALRPLDFASRYVELASRGNTSCGRLETGAVECWWRDDPCQQIEHDAPVPECGPARLEAPRRVRGLDDAVELAMANRYLCARRRGGGVACFQQPTLEAIPVAGIEDAVQIDAASELACAVTASGRLVCWGSLFSTFHLDRPRGEGNDVVRAIPGVEHAVEVALGRTHACVRTREGTVRCFGDAPDPRPRAPRPGRVVQGLTRPIQLRAGSDHTCVLEDDGRVRCWGEDRAGQLGAGDPVYVETPVRVPLP